MKKILLAVGVVLVFFLFFIVNAVENDKLQYFFDWWYQSVNVVGSYYICFGLQICNDIYFEYEVFVKKDWFDFYGYVDVLVFFGGNFDVKGIWNYGFLLFMEIELCFFIDKLINIDFSFGLFKEWYFVNNYIYDMGCNKDGCQSIWYMGLGIDIDIGLLMSLFMNVYVKYQWQNYGAVNENEWDGYCFKIKYFVLIIDLWGGQLSYIGFINFDWGFDLGDDSGNVINGIKICINNFIVFSYILVLNYDYWYYFVVVCYWYDGGQWNDDVELNFGNGNFNVCFIGWGGYLVVGYNF